ncbi:hypothetical protein SAMN04488045_2991 [Thalassococcus halodurans]|uniref:Tripartite ATP-independent transporter, DctQ component n=1 Tax=Thalassococcus halodurans TaxID=373675 RepID=A0A1H6AJC3_9RHOB|nr:hypothetical protein [Thalassococcus halodurans]SEG48839.1 hypothetical protein SAMN04488045_2991 [Thalassococcus halodurans]
MSGIFDIIASTEFRNTMYGLSIVCLILAVGVAIVAMVFYGRARETEGVPKEQEKWVLLFATWRDSLIITLLYTSESIVYRFSEFSGLSEVISGRIYLFSPVVQPVFSLITSVLIFMIVVTRVIAISRWLGSQKDTR